MEKPVLTLGLVQLSFGKTKPPCTLIACWIASVSFGSRYTGASDAEDDELASEALLCLEPLDEDDDEASSLSATGSDGLRYQSSGLSSCSRRQADGLHSTGRNIESESSHY
jgi:hypothetical protein